MSVSGLNQKSKSGQQCLIISKHAEGLKDQGPGVPSHGNHNAMLKTNTVGQWLLLTLIFISMDFAFKDCYLNGNADVLQHYYHRGRNTTWIQMSEYLISNLKSIDQSPPQKGARVLINASQTPPHPLYLGNLQKGSIATDCLVLCNQSTECLDRKLEICCHHLKSNRSSFIRGSHLTSFHLPERSM